MFILSLCILLIQIHAADRILPGQVLEVDTTNASKVQICMGQDNRYYISAYDTVQNAWSSPQCIGYDAVGSTFPAYETYYPQVPVQPREPYYTTPEIYEMPRQSNTPVLTETSLLPAKESGNKEPENKPKDCEKKDNEAKNAKKNSSTSSAKRKTRNSAPNTNILFYLLVMALSCIIQ
ncbi:uncharacterized protein VICG_00312 [Vittaforma corneae ATCC 50505]|uniref:Uncharacterized protein n=1 Tax=Vittaforma corneae (strain ATCC 50505) TaxID=993615 RepID=L2GPY6_VITCO|nr:uncharacterized protein VICG_00312 [Vittaforma corneae ATCC 50505]ELA42560.1 hypothetical protein VICG_00312 [Vittaforma corneae ATCC 50505]